MGHERHERPKYAPLSEAGRARERRLRRAFGLTDDDYQPEIDCPHCNPGIAHADGEGDELARGWSTSTRYCERGRGARGGEVAVWFLLIAVILVVAVLAAEAMGVLRW